MHITFTTLAVNQTHYFLSLCVELEKLGYTTSIISFHEDSNELIKSKGVKCYNVFEKYRSLKQQALDVEKEFSTLLKKYNIDCPNILLSHEKETFGVKDSLSLKEKFVLYFKSLEFVFDDLQKKFNEDIEVFQELGGFASIVSTFYVARARNLNNIFLEPSFYKGRLFFVKNTFDSYKVVENENDHSPDATAYLQKAKEKKTIVIPQKDASHYRHPIWKIANWHNFKRLFQKIFSKYIFGKQEEFNYIGSFVHRHVRMLINRLLLTKYYQQIPAEKFIYYPFHVPMDVALTVRAPLFVDQYTLIDYIARNIPNGYKLAIKEHPAMIGVVHYNRVKDLLNKNDNVVLLNPEINNHEVMKRMELLVTVNSKTGAESLMNGKRVVCLGDSFYNKSKSITYVENIKDFYLTINTGLAKPEPTQEGITLFFQSAYLQAYPGELYFCSEDNILASVKSITSFLNLGLK